VLGAPERVFGVEEILGNTVLLLIGQDEAATGADDGGGHGQPGEQEMFEGDGIAHKNNQQRHNDRQELGAGQRGTRGFGKAQRIGGRSFPCSSEEDDGGGGKRPNKVAQSGSGERSCDEDKVGEIGKGCGGKDQRQNNTKRAKPRRKLIAGAKGKAQGKEKIANNVENEDLAKDGGLFEQPARGREEEVQIHGNGHDGDLKEVQYAEPVDAGGRLVGGRKKHQKDGSWPNKEEDVGRPRGLSSTRNKTLVIGSDGLSGRLESKGKGKKDPKLPRVTESVPGTVVAGNGSQRGCQEIETIASEDGGPGGTEKGDLGEEQSSDDDGGDKEEAREPARRKQKDLTGKANRSRQTW